MSVCACIQLIHSNLNSSIPLPLKMRKKVEEETLSSPSHEFSFTISLHHKSPTPPLVAVDLSPADDIFFHGHLLPLHLLSHLPSSPRSSTNSNDIFTLPIKELLQEHPPKITNSPQTRRDNKETDQAQPRRHNPKSKPKSFSLFRWRNSKESGDEEKQKGKIVNILKRYMRMVNPILSSFRRDKVSTRRQPYTFSGSLMRSGFNNNNINKVGFSAPPSIRTSPNNSGLLVQNGVVLGTSSSNTSDSTMEELQSAIQAAIAHCKSSIATEDNNKGNCQSLKG